MLNEKSPLPPPFLFFQKRVCWMGWEKLLLRLFLFSRVVRLQVGENTTGTQRKRWEQRVSNKLINKWQLSYGSKSAYPFSNRDFSLLFIWFFRLTQILTFNNHIRQQNGLLRGGKKNLAEMCPGCVAAVREILKASAAFNKDTLICSERLPVNANKDSTGCSLYSRQFLFFFSFSASAEHFQRLSVIQTMRIGWHSV